MAELRILTDEEINRMTESELRKNIEIYGNELNRRLEKMMRAQESALESYMEGITFLRETATKVSNTGEKERDGLVEKFEFDQFTTNESIESLRFRLRSLTHALASQKSTPSGIRKIRQQRFERMEKFAQERHIDISRLTSEDWEFLRDVLDYEKGGYTSGEIMEVYCEYFQDLPEDEFLEFLRENPQTEKRTIDIVWKAEEKYGGLF